MRFILWFLGVDFLLVVVYFGLLLLQTWRDVKDSPRVPMFVCDKHGAIPSQYTLKLSVPVMENPFEVCPMCYEDKMRAAKAGTL